MLDNIRAHSLMVARVAAVIHDGLLASPISKDQIPPRGLVLAGALLHDIAKTPCLNDRCEHAKLGRELCMELGFPEVAEVVLEHVLLSDFSPSRYAEGLFLAKELVYYADKRVRHDEIVSLQERLDYILSNYGNNDPHRHSLIRENFHRCQQLEDLLMPAIGMEAGNCKSAVAQLDMPAFQLRSPEKVLPEK